MGIELSLKTSSCVLSDANRVNVAVVNDKIHEHRSGGAIQPCVLFQVFNQQFGFSFILRKIKIISTGSVARDLAIVSQGLCDRLAGIFPSASKRNVELLGGRSPRRLIINGASLGRRKRLCRSQKKYDDISFRCVTHLLLVFIYNLYTASKYMVWKKLRVTCRMIIFIRINLTLK